MKRKVRNILKKMFISFAALGFVLSMFTQMVNADGTFYVADEIQEQSAWCWAACAKALAEQEGPVTVSQTEVVEAVKGFVIDAGAPLEELAEAASYCSGGKEFVALYRPLTFAEIVEVIENGHMIAANCGYFYENQRLGGHSVLITGYSVRNEKEYLYYYDPLNGSTTEISYAYFCERPSGYKTLRYQHSVFYTEDESIKAEAVTLAEKWRKEEQIWNMEHFAGECVVTILISFGIGFSWYGIVTYRMKRKNANS